MTEQEAVQVRDGLGLYAHAYELGDGGESWTVSVVDLAANRLSCEVRVEDGATWPQARRDALMAQIRLDGGRCVAPTGPGISVRPPTPDP